MIKPNDAAFPTNDCEIATDGITVRAYIATHIVGHIFNSVSEEFRHPDPREYREDVAYKSVALADALIERLNREN